MLLGLDVGTSALKGVVIEPSGRVIAVESTGYPVARPHPGWSEQDPMLWWHAARDVVARLGAHLPAGSIEAIGLSGQMHGLVLLDDQALASGGGEIPALRPALLWNDQRTANQCLEIERRAGGRAALVEKVGNAALTGFTLPKILWVREHEPALFARVRTMMLPKDYLRLCLTGEAATDVGDAAGTLLFDIDRRRWHATMAAEFSLDPALLPRVKESAEVAGVLTPRVASLLGLRAGIPVIAGSGDNQAGAVGAGIVDEGLILATIGTSGVVYAHSARPDRDLGDPAVPGRLHTMCAADGSMDRPGHWSLTGCTLSAGGALAWARDLLAPGVPFDTLVEEAMAAPPGARGLVFLPHLTGERCPHPDPWARGAWIGLTARHTRPDLIRAVIEGVTFTLGGIVGLMRDAGITISRARVGGGGARSPAWRQLLADEFGVPLSLPTTEEGPAFGAALLAGVGAGWWPTVREACAATISDRETIDPRRSGEPGRDAAREVFRTLYNRLAGTMRALSDADT